MSEQSCTTKEGLAACTPITSSDKGCGCSSEKTMPIKLEPQKKNSIQSAILFGVACITSPCCVPLIAPVILGVLAGTPLAVWLTAHVGWLYGGLTLVSAVSFLLAWRVMNQKSSSRFSLVTEIRKCLKPINTLVQNRISR